MLITAWILTRISRSQREEEAVLHPIEVRVATLNDLAFVSQDQYLPDTIVQRKIGEGEVFVATVNSELVGYMRLEHLWSVIPYIALIRVLPVYRRQGIGKALLGF